MATPQWILVQQRLEPTQKSLESQFEINSKRRQREAVRSAIKRGVLKMLDQALLSEREGVSSNEEDREKIIYLSLPSLSIQSIDELVILSSPKLAIINLPCNFISDLRPLQSCINLIKLDVSGNEIQVLPESKFWSALLSLKILYLHGNLISQKECMLKLGDCPQLQILTLHDTPVSLLSNYRHIAANCILSLKALDYHIISDEEIIENLHLLGKFKALARSFHKLLYLPVNQNDGYTSELKRVHSLLLTVDIAQSHYSPVIIIQRWVRGWLVRKKLPENVNCRLSNILQRRQKRELDLRNVLSRDRGHKSSKSFPSLLKSTDPPPPTTSPDIVYPLKQTTILLSCILKRPDTAELYQAINNAQALLKKNSKPAKKIKKIAWQPIKKQPPSDEEETDLSITGRHRSVEHMYRSAEMKKSVKESSQDIRKAKKEIKDIVARSNEAVETGPRPEVTQDTHRFIRGHATMKLETLRKLEKRCRYNRKSIDLSVKTDLVSQVRFEREVRKERLHHYQQMVKDNVMNWRIEEEHRLEKEKVKLDIKHEQEHMRRVANVEAEEEITEQKLEEEKFAKKFSRRHVKIQNTIAREKRRLEECTTSQVVQEFVQGLRETENEQQETAKRYMKMREDRLRKDILQDKNDLNAQMIQIASQQLMEAKQKVAREKTRKQAAQDLSPLLTNIDTPRHDLSDALRSIPEATMADHGGLLGPLLRVCESDTYSPKSTRQRTLGSHRTWQRGSHVIEKTRLHFPEISRQSEDTPLMYSMYRPLPSHWQNVGTTPFNSPRTSRRNTAVGSPVMTAGTSNLYSAVPKYTRDEDRILVNMLTYSL